VPNKTLYSQRPYFFGGALGTTARWVSDLKAQSWNFVEGRCFGGLKINLEALMKNN
jgi:hypothetical protein